jgi:hypothetical protein
MAETRRRIPLGRSEPVALPLGMQSENQIAKNVVALAFLLITTIMVVYATTILFDKVTIIGKVYGQVSASSSSSPTNPLGVKIVNPDYNHATNVKDKLEISGESRYDPSQDCEVSVIVNDVKPYQKATPTGARMENDYSTWNYTIDSDYTTIREGDNRVTARLICSDEQGGDLRKWNSVNVVGQTGTDQTKRDMISIPIDTESSSEGSTTIIQIDRDAFVNLINDRIGNNTEAIRESIMYVYTGKE